MAKATAKLTAQERVVLFCTATGISPALCGRVGSVCDGP
jgi:hypothetical protein